MLKNNWFTIKKIHPQIYALVELFHWQKVVSYLFLAKKQAILFDTGMGYGKIKQAVQSVTRLPVKVFLTHAHWDHIGGGADFKSVFVFNHPFALRKIKKGFDSKDIADLNNKNCFNQPYQPKHYQVKGVASPFCFKDGQEISLGEVVDKAIHVPGHTPDSCCFYLKKLNVLLTGDFLYPGPIYVDLPESNFFDYQKSVKKINSYINPKTMLLPGHNQMRSSYGLFAKLKKCLFRASLVQADYKKARLGFTGRAFVFLLNYKNKTKIKQGS